MSIYVDLTREFNKGRLRAVICSGQAVVLHRLAIMSKDGDWILREDAETLAYIRDVLAGHGARYRFGAPLEERWMAGGWSSHFEFEQDGLRVRTDFFTRPPRIDPGDLQRMWAEQERRDPPFVDARLLALMKMTNREKDYAVIGELARIMFEPRDQLLFSRSARDLIALAGDHPELVAELAPRRAALRSIAQGRDALEAALDAERRALIHENERRLQRYMRASAAWAEAWPRVSSQIGSLSLPDAHARLVSRAEELLPAHPADEGP